MNKENSPFPGFDWAETQRRFLDAVSAMGAGREQSNPWQQALEFWWQRALPSVSDDQGVLGNLLRQSQALFGINEQFGDLLKEMVSCEPSDDWQAILDKHLDRLKAHFMDLSKRGAPSTSPWQEPLDTWARTLSWLSLLSPTPDAGGNYGFPDLPSLGGSRGFQQRQLHAMELWRAYLEKLQDYHAEMARVGARAVDQLRDRILAMGEGGKKITSLRELYDLWTDCCEQAFGDEVMTDAYAELYSAVVNALVEFKQHSQMMVEEILGALDLPTRTGLDTMQRRQHEMRREIRSASERESENMRAIADLKQELETLRRELSTRSADGKPKEGE